VGVSASTKLIRSEWGLGAYVPAVSDEVELSIEVELLSQ
jgi:polyisoprenoid-binding protein YceI